MQLYLRDHDAFIHERKSFRNRRLQMRPAGSDFGSLRIQSVELWFIPRPLRVGE
jgi:hypothetical protein